MNEATPEGWTEKPLKDLVDFLDGQRRPIKSADRNHMRGPYPYYGASGIIDWVNGYLFDDELILLGEDGENILSRNLPLAFAVSGKIWVNNHAHVLRPKIGVNVSFLTQLLEFQNYAELNSGTAQPKLNLQSCKSLRLVVPEALPEQQAIAAALSDADGVVAGLERVIAKKRLIKQGAMQDLLTARRRLPGFSGEWEEATLPELAEIRSGGTPSTSDASLWDGDIAWVTPTDITALDERKFLSGTTRTISRAGLRQSSAELLPEGTIVMTSRATIGECAIATIPVTTNQGFKNFIPKERAERDFMYYLLTSQKKGFIELCSGSTFLEIGKTQLNGYTVRVPETKKEQQAIAAVLSDVDAEIQTLESRLTKARAVKEGMMQNLLTGRVRLV